jgi:hypothetical protein
MKERLDMGTQAVRDNEKPTVFISFNSESSKIVNSLEKKIAQKATVVRYEDGITTWGSFTDFMNKISEKDFAVLVISKAFLKSNVCMYEVLQLIKDKNWRNKTMFVIMPDGENIFNENGHIGFIEYWIA